MLNKKTIVVVMPAYNAYRTLPDTVADIPRDIVDDIVLVDDASQDATVKLATTMGVKTFFHMENFGYGRNQKTCFNEALHLGADIVIMLHPDYQYTPRLIPAMASMVAWDEFDLVLGSRILGTGALDGGMPLYKFLGNRFLTLVQNVIQGQKLSEYHTGYRAFSRKLLTTLPLLSNSDGFVFDNELIAQAKYFNFRIGELSCPTRYFPAASSIDVLGSFVYGLGVLWTASRYRLQRWHLGNFNIFDPTGPKLPFARTQDPYYEAVR